jgi:hypothetical protein
MSTQVPDYWIVVALLGSVFFGLLITCLILTVRK